MFISDGIVLLCVQSELKTYIGRVLDEAAQKWNNGEEPKREDGCYTSPVAYDIIQVSIQQQDEHEHSEVCKAKELEAEQGHFLVSLHRSTKAALMKK